MTVTTTMTTERTAQVKRRSMRGALVAGLACAIGAVFGSSPARAAFLETATIATPAAPTAVLNGAQQRRV